MLSGERYCHKAGFQLHPVLTSKPDTHAPNSMDTTAVLPTHWRAVDKDTAKEAAQSIPPSAPSQAATLKRWLNVPQGHRSVRKREISCYKPTFPRAKPMPQTWLTSLPTSALRRIERFPCRELLRTRTNRTHGKLHIRHAPQSEPHHLESSSVQSSESTFFLANCLDGFLQQRFAQGNDHRVFVQPQPAKLGHRGHGR